MEKNTQLKAVIYCRVSTKEQAAEGNSLITQERNCREYALKQGYAVAHVFIEEGESAKTADRTELQKLLRFCSDKKQNINAVIIYKIDRLSRNTDDYSQIRILLKRYGVEIKSTSEYFENTPAGRFMENIIANVAQFDNDVRTERSVGGMRDAVREGRYVWMAPIGYKNEKVKGKSTIIHSDKALLVKMAFEMMAERKHSINTIIETLSHLGLPLGKSYFYKMLKNELYTGWICKFGERHKGNFESIISQELFNRVQQVVQHKNNPLIYIRENPDFPLRRFIRHPLGFKLTGSWSKGRYKRYPYYRFIQIRLQWPKIDLETAFHLFMDKYAFDENLLHKLETVMSIKFSDNSKFRTKNIQELSAKKRLLKDNQNTLLQKNIKGIISDTLLKEQLAILDEEIWSIDYVLMQNEENKVDVKKILEYISGFLLHPSKTWQAMPLHIKTKFQWFQFPEGLIFDGKKFRTTKLSSIFKLKLLFQGQMSSDVDYQITDYEHENPSNSPPLQLQENIAWDDIEKELRMLEEIMHSSNTTSGINPLPFLDSG